MLSGNGMMGDGMMGEGFAAIVGLVLVVTIVALALEALGGTPEHRQTQERQDPAESALRERFARGEIDADEYEGSLRILREGPGESNYEDHARTARK